MQRLSPESLKPVEIRSLNDIQGVLAQLNPTNNTPAAPIPIETQLEVDEDGKKVRYKVSATTKSKSKRDILIEGFDLIKKRIDATYQEQAEELEINGKTMRPATMRSNVDGISWVDPLIKQWTGGTRKGVLITWDIQDGHEYRYEIYSHRLTKIRRITKS